VTAPVVEIVALRKEYRRRGRRSVGVDGLDLVVPAGGVFGFLGPNGSGKTTTIRCLLGLVRPTSGRCRVLGADARTGLASVIGRIGAVVETPALFPGFSGRRNLELLGRIHGSGPRAVGTVLERVGLGDRGDDLVKTYSLGMRQRLGLGAALLKDPELLILDEPANGLDPAGIKEVRELLLSLGAEGRTVFVSSHILSEVQQACDSVAILSQGRLVAAGQVGEVLASGRPPGLLVGLDDLGAGAAVLAAAGWPVEQLPGRLRVGVAPEHAARVTQALAAHELWVTELRPEEVSLEDLFLELTGKEQEAA